MVGAGAEVARVTISPSNLFAVVALQSRNGAIVGLETPDGDQCSVT